MTKKKDKYDKYLLYTLLTFIFIGILGSAIESQDLDDVCEENNNLLKRKNNLWNCSLTSFGELIITTDTTINIPTQKDYYNITNMTIEHSQNIGTDNNSMFTITKAGNYEIKTHTSFSGGGNTEYEMEVFINNIEHDHCELHRKMGAGGDVGSASLGCFETFNIGDNVTIKVADNTNPSQDITIHHMSFMIQEIQ